MNSAPLASGSPRSVRWALSAVRRNIRFDTPGISTGYCRPRNTPGGGALVRRQRQQVLPHERHAALGHFIAVAAGQHIGQRRLAGAVRPHDGVHLAGTDAERQALEDLLAVNFGVKIVDLEHSAGFLRVGGLTLDDGDDGLAAQLVLDGGDRGFGNGL